MSRTHIFRHDGPFWRGLATFGAGHAPRALVRYSPPAWALAFALAMPEARARVRLNLRRVLGVRPNREELADIFRTFSHFASCLTEGLAMGGPHPPVVERVVEGAVHLEQALSMGRGVILLTAHTGGWETLGPLLKTDFDLDVMIAMQREPDEEARRIQDRARMRAGIKVAHVGHDPLAVLQLFTHLRGGGVLGVQIDRAPDAMRSLPVQFLGAPWRVPQGPFELARVTGAPIVPVFTRRLGYFRYEIHLCPLIELERKAPSAALIEAARGATVEMERFIRAHPTHWFDFA
jgi:phosphatidylinositol dimannoside acyltransferase